jgi:hypothetical protein
MAPGNGEAPIHPKVKEGRLLSTYFSACAMRSRNGSGLSWAVAALFQWR